MILERTVISDNPGLIFVLGKLSLSRYREHRTNGDHDDVNIWKLDLPRNSENGVCEWSGSSDFVLAASDEVVGRLS